QFVALSTQCVGIGANGTVPMVARVSLVDFRGQIILDTYIRPTNPVFSYRTTQTGIEPHHLENAPPFEQVKAIVEASIRGKTVVGHTLWEDFEVMGLRHPAYDTRDTALYLPYREALKMMNRVIGLPTLVFRFMQHSIAVQRQDSLENARALIDLYR
ncbi:hypothetical protein DL93DRAFT_2034817, partial [Clavulina sp. PMI_390]